MIAFGGGGPMFSTAIAEELGLKRVVIGRVPGVFSAWGMLMTDLRHDYIQTKVMKLELETLGEIRKILSEMKEAAVAQLKSEGIEESEMRFESVLDIRYSGQEHTVATPATEIEGKEEGGGGRKNIEALRRRFDELHKKQFTFILDDPLEVVNTRLTAFGRVKKPAIKPGRAPSSNPRAKAKSSRRVLLDGGEFKEIPVYERDSLPIGAKIRGPAIVEEQTATTIVRKGTVLTNDRYRNLVIEV
jgi:N-methylhydantoinase A